MLTTLSFSTSIGIITGMSDPFESMHNELNSSHDTLIVDDKIYDIDKLINWWESNDEVESVISIPFVRILDHKHNKEKKDNGA